MTAALRGDAFVSHAWLHAFVGKCLDAEYGRGESFWSTEATSCLPAVDDDAVLDKLAQRGETTAYVRERRVCQLPTRDPKAFAAQLRTVHPLPRITVAACSGV